jgi:hypothetical protein
MRAVANTYFKTRPNGPGLLSGLPIPPKDRPTRFVKCTFHPAVCPNLYPQLYHPESKFYDCLDSMGQPVLFNFTR